MRRGFRFSSLSSLCDLSSEAKQQLNREIVSTVVVVVVEVFRGSGENALVVKLLKSNFLSFSPSPHFHLSLPIYSHLSDLDLSA